MQYYTLRISYDGTAYSGWQIQPHAITVCGMLQASFEKVFGVPCSMVGASRTDAGVHAYDQVARIATTLSLSPAAILHAWNNRLPSDIFIRSIAECESTFHPQYHVAYKEYWYHFFLSRPLPFVARFGWPMPEYISGLDGALFARTLKLFEGTHDFTSFARVEEGYNPVRAVDSIRVEELKRYNALRVVVRGEGFLRFQVRRMVGAALMVARDGAVVSYDDIISLLKTPQRTSPAFLNVAAQGLCLRKIVYKKDVL
ncbi:MAG: tRNA pseudouridine38-40 synthase [Candidatus Dependentiae bacterium]|nr:tRNA pseudouridine38-40 synthase [Candidatus Dependentiae bacterium]